MNSNVNLDNKEKGAGGGEEKLGLVARALKKAPRALKDLPIAGKIILGFGALILIIFISIVVTYTGSGRATREITQVTDTQAPTALEASRAQANLLRMLADVRGYLALSDSRFREDYFADSAAFEQNLDNLEHQFNSLEYEDIERVVQLRVAYEDWSSLPERLFELHDDQLDREPAYRLLATEGVRHAGEVLIAVNTMIDEQGQREATPQNLTLLEDMANFQGNFAAMLSALRGYVTTRNRIYRGEYDVNLVVNTNAWERLQQQQDQLSASQRDLLDVIAEHRAAFLALPDEIFTLLEGPRWREDLYLFREQAVPLAERMQTTLNEMTLTQQEELQSNLEAGRGALANTNSLILAGGVVALFMGVVMAFVSRETIAAPVVRLTNVAEEIRDGNLEAQAPVESGDEIGILAATFNTMTDKLRTTLLQVRKEKNRADSLLDVVIPIGVDLSTERDFNRLLENMLVEAKQFCHADAGTLYLIDEQQLRFVIVRNDTADLMMGGPSGEEVTYEPLPLESATGDGDYPYIAVGVALSGESSNIQNYDTASTLVEDYKVQTLLTVPLKNSEEEVLGVLQLINPRDPETGEITAFDENLQEMMESFSSLAVAALEGYIREQALRNTIQQLRIEIDEAKKARQVAEITETDYFSDLRRKARELRNRIRDTEDSDA